ncbi:MAG: TolC family outer membrane protein [Pseudomonadota bacterium]
MQNYLKLRSCLGTAVLLPLLGAALMSHSVDASATNLFEAYQAARVNDSIYRAAFYANENGKENRILGRSGLLPSLAASYSNSRNRTDIFTDLSTSHPQYNSRNSTIQLRQALLSLDAIARYKQGRAQADASASQLDADGQEMILRVVGAYIEAAFSNEQVELSIAERDMYFEQRKLNDMLFAKGEGTKTDMLEIQARLDLAEAKLLETKDNQKAAFTTLSAIMGREVTAVDRLRAEFQVRPLDKANFDTWKTSALAHNPELSTQTYSIEVAHQEVNKARAGHTPRLDLIASYSKSSSESINTLNQDSTVRSIGIQLNIPLYSGGSVNAQTRQAVANEERTKADLQSKKDKVLLELRKDYDAATSSVARIAALEKSVASGKLLIKATEQSIRGGVRITSDLLNAQQQLSVSQRDLAQSRYSYLVTSLRMRAAAGTLSADDVREVAGNFQ